MRAPAARAVSVFAMVATALAGCRGILGIDALPPLEGDAGGTDATLDGAPDTTPDANDAGCDPGAQQALQTDPDNCGACGHRCCGLLCVDGGCATGVPRTLASGLSHPSVVALDPDGTSVYYSQSAGDAGYAIQRFVKGAPQATTLVQGLGYMNAMEVGDTAIFVTTSDGHVTSVAPKSGASPAPAATVISSGNDAPQGLALAGDLVWWVEGAGGAQGQGAIHAAHLDGTGQQRVYAGRTSPLGLVVSRSTVAWTEFDVGHDVVVGTTDGGATFTLDAGQQVPAPILWNGSGVWWGDFNGTGVFALGLDGGQSRIATASGGVTAIAADGSYLYWLVLPQGGTPGGGTLWTTQIDGGSGITQLAENLACPVAIVADDTCLYWVNAGTCSGDYDSYKAQAGTGSVMSMEHPR